MLSLASMKVQLACYRSLVAARTPAMFLLQQRMAMFS